MFVVERLLSGLIKVHGNHPVSTDGGTWYPDACRILQFDHHVYSFYKKSLVERTIRYIKDRIECFDDYFPLQAEGM
jgi:putative transposase